MSDTGHPATVQVVTGLTGTDVGPFCAWLGRDLEDGLAVRVVRSNPDGPLDRRGAFTHVSRTGFEPGHLVAAPTGFGAQTGAQVGLAPVPLWCLPSAWQHPDTHLGVLFTGAVTRDLVFDVETLRGMGVDVRHRLTVQHTGIPAGYGGLLVPHPIDVAPLAEIARDSVLRGSAARPRRVLVEAGDGWTPTEALGALGLPPDSPHIDVLELWLVVNAEHAIAAAGLKGAATDYTTLLGAVTAAANAAVRHCGLPAGGRVRPSVRVALANVQAVLPGVAGHPALDTELWELVLDLAGLVAATTGVKLGAVSTGPDVDAPWLDLHAPSS
jgi:hypothetical protein